MMFVNSHNDPKEKLTITKLQDTFIDSPSTQDVVLNCSGDQNLDMQIHLSVAQNRQEIVEQLIKYRVDVNVRGKNRMTALHVSVVHNSPKITRLLLENGADPDLKDLNGKTPLHWACWCGSLENVNELLDYGADVNAEDNYGATPLTSIQPSNNTWIKLQFHVVKLQTANMHVSKRNENYITKCIMQLEMNYVNAAELRRFEKKAVEETLQMEIVPIAVCTTLADVLPMSANKLSVFKSNKDFQKLFNAKDFKKKYPIYANLVEACYRKGVIRSDLMSSAKDAFRKILGLPLPDDCCDVIFQYLDNENLHNLMESAEIKIIAKRKILLEESNESIQAKKVRRI